MIFQCIEYIMVGIRGCIKEVRTDIPSVDFFDRRALAQDRPSDLDKGSDTAERPSICLASYNMIHGARLPRDPVKRGVISC